MFETSSKFYKNTGSFMANCVLYQTLSTGYLYRAYSQIANPSNGQKAGLAFTILTMLSLWFFMQFRFQAKDGKKKVRTEAIIVMVSFLFGIIQNGLLTEYYYRQLQATAPWKYASFHFIFLWLQTVFQILALVFYFIALKNSS